MCCDRCGNASPTVEWVLQWVAECCFDRITCSAVTVMSTSRGTGWMSRTSYPRLCLVSMRLGRPVRPPRFGKSHARPDQKTRGVDASRTRSRMRRSIVRYGVARAEPEPGVRTRPRPTKVGRVRTSSRDVVAPPSISTKAHEQSMKRRPRFAGSSSKPDSGSRSECRTRARWG
jgi:hypothetical protein